MALPPKHSLGVTITFCLVNRGVQECSDPRVRIKVPIYHILSLRIANAKAFRKPEGLLAIDDTEVHRFRSAA